MRSLIFPICGDGLPIGAGGSTAGRGGLFMLLLIPPENLCLLLLLLYPHDRQPSASLVLRPPIYLLYCALQIIKIITVFQIRRLHNLHSICSDSSKDKRPNNQEEITRPVGSS